MEQREHTVTVTELHLNRKLVHGKKKRVEQQHYYLLCEDRHILQQDAHPTFRKNTLFFEHKLKPVELV